MITCCVDTKVKLLFSVDWQIDWKECEFSKLSLLDTLLLVTSIEIILLISCPICILEATLFPDKNFHNFDEFEDDG